MIHRGGIVLKSAREIELMRAAGRVVYQVLTRVRELVKPGVTTVELNRVAEQMIEDVGGEPLFKGVTNPHAKFPFPAALCTSVNEELVHGIPNDQPLKEGDILSVDCGVRLEGYCGDSATTIPVGKTTGTVDRLLDVTERVLSRAIEQMKPGRQWSEIASEMQRFVEDFKFSVVRDFVGHGIGREMHEEPKVPNYWNNKHKQIDFELMSGMVLAVEPMVNIGGHAVDYGSENRWVVVTADRKFCAHFEHTVAIKDDGSDVLTDGR